MFRRKSLSLIALCLMVCLVMSVFAGCEKKPAAAAETAAPTEAAKPTEAATTAPAAAPAVELANAEAEGKLSSWELNADVWSSSNGATVTLTAVPRSYSQNDAVYFVIHLDGQKMEDIPCKWDGKTYSASADLEAADGYEYECVYFEGQGEGESIMLSDVYDSLVYLKRSLTAYCNLIVSDFKVTDGKFMITAGFAHVQLPQLNVTGTNVSLQKSELVFVLNGTAIETQAIDLPVGEGVGSHESAISATGFTMPQMDDDYQLDLELHVTLSNGEELSSNGGSWYYNNGELKMSAG